ncbi:ABC transporter ATP-binding protein [Magnetospirillum fulvum]|uniref:Putative ABC transport system ATP-binding protein n=1 Tax=Magnetospirillum fulvum TaxID=1082 RepID=A0A1H6GU49_MAGFU|nr:ATP-binding cassette domain-containing protein [Magnetospirillum fulvum]SEH25668.1 putative ABC transport system ATP-binding protein [Magnetospirillum fulvum]
MTLGLAMEGLVLDRSVDGGEFVLDQPDLSVPAGASIALLGPSGCGKSTLLDVIALILRPTRLQRLALRGRDGRLVELGHTLRHGSSDQLASWRSGLVGYVMQTGGLLPFATVGENIALPRRILGLKGDAIVQSLARRLGIVDLLNRRPDRLSVGQRQRVAVARALSHQPPLVIADEPTASLDPAIGDVTMDLLLSACQELGSTLIVSTHDHDRARRFGLVPLEFSPANGCSRFQFQAGLT